MKKIQKVPLLPQVGSPNQKHVGLIKSSGEDVLS
jgi:hypothetical protein